MTARLALVLLPSLLFTACRSPEEDSGNTDVPVTDADGDGVDDEDDAFPNDATETVDTDGDGVGDNADDDDDDDGFSDLAEAECLTEPLDSTSVPLDTDGDGLCDDPQDDDDDGDGVSDADDVFPLDATEWVDTDGDGTGDEADDDDDDDGTLDVDDDLPLDATETVDTDGDGTGNNADLDDDGDGVVDSLDAFPEDPAEQLDTDGDGTGNEADDDDDDDGVLDVEDAFPVNPEETTDTDGDGTGNNSDLDDDGDGFSDADETDCDSDPLDSSAVPADVDGDGLCDDGVDDDDDDDGYSDHDEIVCGSDPDDPSALPEDFDSDGLCDRGIDPDDDNDGSGDGVDCAPLDDQRTPGAEELDDGIDNDCDLVCDEGFVQPGDLIISEFMFNPNAVEDSNGEWFEVFNASSRDIVVCGGWTAGDLEGDLVSLPEGAVIAAGEYSVFATNDDSSTNGGVDVTVDLPSSFYLAQGGDEIVLTFDGEVIDEIAYDMSMVEWYTSNQAGYSLQLCPNNDAIDNDDAENWSKSSVPYGLGDFGTPGAPSSTCTGR